ncbi:protein containing DUF927, partial [mine drainage metagenome]
MASRLALRVPTTRGQTGNTGTNREPGRPFELRTEWLDKLRPGVYWHEQNVSDESAEPTYKPPIWICDALEVAAGTRDAHGGEWGRLLRFRDGDGTPKNWAMPLR